MVRNLRWGVALLVLVLLPRPAAAYVDPAAGSMMLQLVLGGLAGLAIALRLLWGRVLHLFGVRRSGGEERREVHPEEPRGV